MEQAEELRQIIQEASAGNWYPALIVSSFFSVIIALLIYIWNITMKGNSEKHKETYTILTELVNSQKKTDVVLAELKIMVEYHNKDIEELKNK